MPQQNPLSEEEYERNNENQFDKATRQTRADIAKADATLEKQGNRGSLGKARDADAHRFALDLLNAMSSSPEIASGRIAGTAEIRTYVKDSLATEKSIPASMRREIEELGITLLTGYAAGNKGEVRAIARAEAVGLGKRLAASSWSKDADDFDARAVAMRMPRI